MKLIFLCVLPGKSKHTLNTKSGHLVLANTDNILYNVLSIGLLGRDT